MSKNIAVFGAGAIGGVIGGYLTRAGRNVTLIDPWPANIEKMRSEGLKVTTLEEEFTVSPCTLHVGEVSASRQTFDIVLISVKSYDTEWGAHFMRPYLASNGYVVSVQNSINEYTIAAVVGWPRVVGCVITMGCELRGPADPHRTSIVKARTAFTLGEPSGQISPRLDELSDILSAVGPVKTTTNLWGQRWAKLGTNCMANAVAGFTGLSSAGVREHSATRELGIRIGAELVKVARALAIDIEPISGIPPHLFLEALEDDAKKKEVENILIEGSKVLGAGRPSLSQDLAKCRKTEVDYLNGYVVQKGGELGIPTPVNKAVLEITKRVEAGEIEPSPDLVWLILE